MSTPAAISTSGPAPLDLGAGLGGTNAGTNTGLPSDHAEQAGLGFLDDLELGVLIIDTEFIKGTLFGFFDRTTGCFNPFHAS